MLGFITWTWDPELLNLGSLSVRWYGLMWAVGLLLGYWVESKIYDREKMPEGTMDKLFLVMVFATIFGARFGHCYYYEWDYFSEHLSEIPFVWKGGLSSHGGAFGILLALFFFSKFVIHKSYLWTLDRIVLAVAICGACIRLGNLFNHEIYGDPTSMPWAFSFMLHPMSDVTGFSEPSHPTQIYEIIYCLVTFSVLMFLYWKTKAAQRTGLLFSVFLLGIFFTRYLVEFIKRPQEAFEEGLLLNMGQRLSIPFVLVASAIILYHLFMWGKARSENKVKSVLAMGAYVAVMAVLSLLPLQNRKQQMLENSSVKKTEVPDMGNPVEMDVKQVPDFLERTVFESAEGNKIHFQGGYIFIQDKRVAGPVVPVASDASKGFYLSADGIYPGSVYRYLLRVYPNNNSILLNLKDLRGNYSSVAENGKR